VHTSVRMWAKPIPLPLCLVVVFNVLLHGSLRLCIGFKNVLRCGRKHTPTVPDSSCRTQLSSVSTHRTLIYKLNAHSNQRLNIITTNMDWKEDSPYLFYMFSIKTINMKFERSYSSIVKACWSSDKTTADQLRGSCGFKSH